MFNECESLNDIITKTGRIRKLDGRPGKTMDN